jgi:hypothetical protein
MRYQQYSSQYTNLPLDVVKLPVQLLTVTDSAAMLHAHALMWCTMHALADACGSIQRVSSGWLTRACHKREVMANTLFKWC